MEECVFGANIAPQLAIVIHTEEEFDWDGGFNPTATEVSHGPELLAIIENLKSIGAKCTLAMDYAFVTSEQGKQCINKINASHELSDHVEFAAHLHPWVNPPLSPAYADAVPEQYSYPGNLPKDEEYSKLHALTKKITAIAGHPPVTYLAGRYGIGKNTPNILKRLGYKVDVSVSPFVDYTHQQGPNFSRFNNDLFYTNGILSWPHTSAVVSPFSFARRHFQNSPAAYSNASFFNKVIRKLVRARLHRLSPEGFSLADMQNVTKYQYDLGQRCFILSFHSPSVKSGLTPYVKNRAQAVEFKQKVLNYANWFKNEFKGEFIKVKDHPQVQHDTI